MKEKIINTTVKKTKKYLLLDTNIYVQCCLLQMIEGDNLDILKGLIVLLDKKELILLVPATVRYEFKHKKVSDEKLEKMGIKLEDYKKVLEGANELDEAVRLEIKNIIEKTRLIKLIDEIIGKRKDNLESVKERIEEIFDHENTVKLKINKKASFEAVKLHFKDRIGIEDALVIKEAKEYFESEEIRDYTLFFCSINKKHFTRNPKEKSNKLALLNSIKKDFKKIKYYPNLVDFLSKEFGEKYSKKSLKSISDLEEEIHSYIEESQRTATDIFLKKDKRRIKLLR